VAVTDALAPAHVEFRLRPYQVSIWDLMLWTCVVIVPLGVVRSGAGPAARASKPEIGARHSPA